MSGANHPTPDREVDSRGNCSKCGGTHYGSYMCPMSQSPQSECSSEETTSEPVATEPQGSAGESPAPIHRPSKKDADLRSNEQIDGLLSALHIEPGLFWARLAVLKWLGPRPNVIVGNARTPHIEELQTTEIERLTRAAAEVEMMALTLEARDKEIERLTRELNRILQREDDSLREVMAERDRLHETVLTEGKKLELADVEIERLTGELGERERLRAMIAERELATRYERNRLRAALEFWMALGHLETYESREAFRKDARELLSGEQPPPETAAPQAPIAKVIVREDGPADVMLYAPGLPPGEHDLYYELEAVAPMMRDGTKAIQTCPTCGADWHWPTSPSKASGEPT